MAGWIPLPADSRGSSRGGLSRKTKPTGVCSRRTVAAPDDTCDRLKHPGCYTHGCPCGYAGDPVRECKCSGQTISRYQKRISGPLLDQIDIHVEVPHIDY
ncbi:MAG: ATP-binding protein [Thermomicrobiales bacterium]